VDSKEELNPSSQVKENGKGELEPVYFLWIMAGFPAWVNHLNFDSSMRGID